MSTKNNHVPFLICCFLLKGLELSAQVHIFQTVAIVDQTCTAQDSGVSSWCGEGRHNL